MINLCRDWEFTECWSEDFLCWKTQAEPVCLPHSVRETPLHYASPADYELLCGYRRRLFIPEQYRGKRLFLQFDGAAHIASLYINGRHCAQHRCGYTAFRVEISDFVCFGEENRLAVKLDTSENPEIPPFGFVIDYLTYGGLYREAWLDVRGQNLIEDIYLQSPELDRLKAQVSVRGTGDVRLSVLDGERGLLESCGRREFDLRVPGVLPWSDSSPKLYTCRAELLDDKGQCVDVQEESFGFRTAQFRADGFYLNGEKTFLRGLNRHQCYPYIGYAAPASLQIEDARILKEELGCNAVRSSHYPQSKHFIKACDALGLLVFTEIPGWQHIGDESWKEQAVENTREMLLQYRNHPSIILWGVRINESTDDDELYRRTNELAHQLDPSRASSGVRYIEKSHLLEDVYAYNDFSHCGGNAGAKPKRKVTPDMSKALLISEHNGHMFPTKAFDPWQKRQEQALRHARVLDAAMASGEHAGCFGWCMFDYPTHKDFGSGDRLCYHGVMDAFRNPKLAAALYASRGEGAAVLEPGSTMDIGDYPAGLIDGIYIFTNEPEIDLYKNDKYVASFRAKDWQGLKHGPVLIDDTIGCLLESQEGFAPGKARLLKQCLNSARKHGLANMPLLDKLKMLYCMLRYSLSFEDGVSLYGKYVGNWGGEATVWRFQGKSGLYRECRPGSKLHIKALASSTHLAETVSYDMAALRIRIEDEYGNPAPYAQLPLSLETEGEIALVGPKLVTAEGGMCGCYVKTTGRAGEGRLIIKGYGLEPVEIEFTIEIMEDKK